MTYAIGDRLQERFRIETLVVENEQGAIYEVAHEQLGCRMFLRVVRCAEADQAALMRSLPEAADEALGNVADAFTVDDGVAIVYDGRSAVASERPVPVAEVHDDDETETVYFVGRPAIAYTILARRAFRLVARAVMPHKKFLGLIAAANVAVFTVGAFAIAGDGPDAIVEPIASPEMLAKLDDARAFLKQGEKKRALDVYTEVAATHVELFGRQDLEAVVGFLSAPNRYTGTAETILVTAGARSIEPLEESWADIRLSRYHRRRVGEVLNRVGGDVDLVPVWIETLRSQRCEARRLAARELGELDDPRALDDLDRLANEGGWSDCGSDAARAAARRIRASHVAQPTG